MVVNRLIPALQISEQLLIIDTLVILFAAITFRTADIALYSVLALYISTKVIDIVFEGVDYAKAVFVISNKSEEISKVILDELERGVTGFYGKGMYTQKNMTILLCIVNRTQIPELKRIVTSLDDKAFVIVTNVREAVGEGFKSHKIA
jgi:uncharacterized membrane-anchored protein YitT (DUF2179 family)